MDQVHVFRHTVDWSSYHLGFTPGQNWATRLATADELQSLKDLWEDWNAESLGDWNYYFDPNASHQIWLTTMQTFLYSVIADVNEAVVKVADEKRFWKLVFGDAYRPELLDDRSVLRGFAEGALTVAGCEV